MKNAHTEDGDKIAGTNLTAIPEYTQTAAALAELSQRHKGVVYDVTQPKQMKLAKEARAEIRGYRTSLEKLRKEIKAPALERCRLIDSEAKRITEELVALEDPIDVQIKAEEGRVEAERAAAALAEEERQNKHRAAIQRLRDFPLSLQDKPSAVIAGRIKGFEEAWQATDADSFEEFYQEAKDAFGAAVYSARELHNKVMQREVEQARLAELEAQAERDRQERAALEARLREAEEREAQRVREEQERAAAAERAEQERLAAEERERQRVIREREDAERHAQMEAQRAAQEAEAARQREEQERLDRERAELERQRQEAAAEAERERLRNLGVREAAEAVVDYFAADLAKGRAPQVISDLAAALDNEASANTVKRS